MPSCLSVGAKPSCYNEGPRAGTEQLGLWMSQPEVRLRVLGAGTVCTDPQVGNKPGADTANATGEVEPQGWGSGGPSQMPSESTRILHVRPRGLHQHPGEGSPSRVQNTGRVTGVWHGFWKRGHATGVCGAQTLRSEKAWPQGAAPVRSSPWRKLESRGMLFQVRCCRHRAPFLRSGKSSPPPLPHGGQVRLNPYLYLEK